MYIALTARSQYGVRYILQNQLQMNNYSSSSYYRANPYKDIGYMPPIAQKNRRSPQGKGEIPQGEQHFEPTMKKHYGFSYSGEIDYDGVLVRQDPMSPLQKQAMQKSYFRSLNSKDIEGSSTNTLISKAVKNKLKAQQQLQRRKEMEKQQAQQKLRSQYQQQYKKKYAQQYRQAAQAKTEQQKPYNYHNRSPSNKRADIIDKVSSQVNNDADQKKKRDMQLLRLAQQRKNYAIVDFPNLITNSNQSANHSSFTNKAKPQQQPQRREQVQNAQRGYFNYQRIQAPEQNYYNAVNIPYRNVQRQAELHENNKFAYQQQKMANQNYINNYRQEPYYEQRNGNAYISEQKNNNNYNDCKQIYERGKTQELAYGDIRNQIEKPYVKQYTTIEQQKYRSQQKTVNKSVNSPNYTAKTYVAPINDSFRKFNPTFLSYQGSPFALASKNVIGR